MAGPTPELRPKFSPFSRTIRIATDLAAISERGEEADPRALGSSRDAIERIWRAAESCYRTGQHPALQLCIYRDGRVALQRAIGHRSGNAPGDLVDAPPQPVRLDTPFVIYSASKGVTSLLTLKLDEIGAIHLEDRVCDYVPPFGKHGKEGITIRHVLTHRSGIPLLPPDADFESDPEGAFQALCELRPQSRPGRQIAYHAGSGGYVLAELVRAATGSDIRAALRRHIADPLGLDWMSYGVAARDLDRVALDAVTGPPVVPPVSWMLRRALGAPVEEIVRIGNQPGFRQMISPSANIVTTAEELARVYACAALDGELDGVRVFEPRTLRRAVSEQSYYEFDPVLGAPLRWGLGLMLGDRVSMFGINTERAFGHLGFTNILAWGDPERRLGVAILNSGKPVVSLGVARLANLVLQIGRAFPRARGDAA
jgi:CubicO group peptidase (beta-lactamase class C family)